MMRLTEIQTPSTKQLFEDFKDNDTGFLTEDLVSIALAIDGPWADLITEGKGKDRHNVRPSNAKGPPQPRNDPPRAQDNNARPTAPGGKGLQIKTCPLFVKTHFEKTRSYPILAKKFEDFKNAKMENPMAPVGSSDKTFTTYGNFKGLKHVHLTPDISLVYQLEGSNPITMKLYGLFSHDELGTGQPPSIRRQQSMGVKIANQEFS
jgi:mRNA-degrading endonuclease YafQ of YafQ-DinJ toxin-antitoxin module